MEFPQQSPDGSEEKGQQTNAMSNSIFDAVDRNVEGGAVELISQFDYLNTSNREEATKVRALMDDFLSRYPAEKRKQLRARLRTVDDIAFQSAFFELALHELAIRSACTILEVEPKVAGTDRSPDFLAKAPDGTEFYLEATLATGRSSADLGAQKRLDQVFKTINSVPSPDFFLSVINSGMPAHPVAGKALKNRLIWWLESLSYEAVAAAYDQDQATSIPTFHFEEHGLTLRISPVPRRRSRGTEEPGRAIAARMISPLTVQPQLPIRDAVTSKATRYGTLDRPYVIAVNAMDTYANHSSAIDALFGSPAVEVGQMKDGSYFERESRAPDGAWHNGTKPQNTRVSAVFSTERLTPWSLGQIRSRLIFNPWAQREVRAPFLDVETHRVENDHLVKSDGKTIANILGLPSGWPE